MGNKKTRKWIGYKVHLSETCDEDFPHLITYVDTKLSSSKDHEIMDNLHKSLTQENLSPEQHFVDSAYIEQLSTISNSG